MTSCIDWPRTFPGDCSPSAHNTASVTFDFPDPLGPTITLTPGPNSSLVRSGKDLNPLTVIDFRYTDAASGGHFGVDSSAACAASCSASFLLRPTPQPISTPSTVALTLKVRSCGGPCSSTTS